MNKKKKSLISWSEEANNEVKKAPYFVRPLIRAKVEKHALENNISNITPELLKELRGSFNVVHNQNSSDTKEGIEQFFVNTDSSPLYSGFKSKPSVHAGASGRAVEGKEAEDLSQKILSYIPKGEKAVSYIHIPFCIKNCDFCAFYKNKTNKDKMDLYVEALVKEIELTGRKIYESGAVLNAVYIGGGTPTDLSVKSLGLLLGAVKKYYPLSNDCEITLEGRLYGFDNEKIDISLEKGVNRFSFGVQSFDTERRRSVGRVLSRDKVLERLSHISSLNQAAVGIDLIFGLPGQSMEDWKEELRVLTEESHVDGCSIYQLNLFPGTPVTEKIEVSKLPPPADIKEQADLFVYSNNYLKNNFAVRGSLRHWKFSSRERSIYNIFSKYGYTCIPAGCGAGGNIGNYSLMQGMSIDSYYKQIEQGIKPYKFISEKNPEYRLFGTITGHIEEFLGLNIRDLGKSFNKDLESLFNPLFSQWEKAGMISSDKNGNIYLTEAGEFWNVNIVQNIIDYYIWKKNS